MVPEKQPPRPVLRKKQDVDMTQGSILRHIIAFSVPLMIGNLFQQMYNMVDTWVIGNFVENPNAFSAVGSVTPIVNMLIGTFLGFSSGAGVVISQYYGAKRFHDVSNAVHTAILMTVIIGLVLTVAGVALIPFMLNLMKMPEEVIGEATTYLTIYFSGLMSLVLYNIGSGILRAVGDSTRPFIFLAICAVVNTVLDLVFVIVFEMGVAGVAIATIIAQGFSAILIMITLMCTKSCIKLQLKKLRIHWSILKKIIRVGIPSALQMSITSFSNVFGQSYINYFGPDCMSGWGTYLKVDHLILLPMQSVSLACTTFVGQNLGKNLVQRAKKGIRISLLLALIITGLLIIPVVVFAPAVAAFFNPSENVVYYGSMLLRWMTPFYMFCVVNQILSCALRGAGNSKAPMITMLMSYVVFRQIYLFCMSHICNEIIPIAMGYPSGWFLCGLATTIYYLKVPLNKTRLVEDVPVK